MSDQFKTIDTLIWNTPSKNYPEESPHIAHYTSLQTVESILKHGEIWFSHPFAMNDHEELLYGLIKGKEILHNSIKLKQWFENENTYASFINLFDCFFKDYEKNHVLDTFIACFSEIQPNDIDGKLSMWRGYGDQGKGAALVLNTSLITNLKESPIVFSKVKYSTRQQRETDLNQSIDRMVNVLNQVDYSQENILRLAHVWFYWLKIHALTTKHNGFSEECEWRFIYMPEFDKNQALKDSIDYHFINGIPEPKLKLKVEHIKGVTNEDASLGHYIDRIILGPCPENTKTLNINTFLRILDQTKNPNLKSRSFLSSIPFRNK